MFTKKNILAAAGLLSASLLMSSPASAVTLHLQFNGPTNLPTSMEDAIDNDFGFTFDSWYQSKETGAWEGGQVHLQRSIFLQANCRLQLHGYIWEDSDAGEVRVAVTHGTNSVQPPSGSNSTLCGALELEFNNGYVYTGFPAVSAGAWVASLPVSALPSSPSDSSVISATFYNVQVGTTLGYCSTARGGTGGDLAVGYSNNTTSEPASFAFSGTISPAAGIAGCQVNGELFSVENTQINNADHTPGIAPYLIPNPSVPSFDKVEATTNP